jgi:hypothetical protein
MSVPPSARWVPKPKRGFAAYQLIALATVVLGAAACSETTSNNATPSPGSTPQHQTSQRPAQSASAAPSSTTITPVNRCEAQDLTVAAAPPSAAMSHRSIQLSFALKPGAAPCVLAGYPAVDVERGVSILTADETPRGYMGGLPAGVDLPPSIALGPGGTAQAIVEGPAIDSAGNNCPTYTDIRVKPPATLIEFTFPTSISVCSLHVHPVTGG